MRQSTDTTARSITRVLAMLRHIAYATEGMRASDLQKELKIPRASMYRVLNALVNEDFIQQDAVSGLYRIGPAAMNLGFWARLASPLVRTAQPVLRDVSVATGHLAELIIAVGAWRSVTLDVWIGRDTPLTVRIRPGNFVNLTHRYVPCALFLAYGGEHRLQEYQRLADTPEGRERLGLKEPVTADDIERLRRWKKLGYAWDPQSGGPGVGRIAAPVFDLKSRTPKVAATIGVACPGKVLTAPRALEWGKILCEHARRLEEEISKS